jgi:aryl-alcohol dehydrogenase-like predicted oxidoreductase
MRQVRLGQTDLKVSAIAFDTWAFGGDWGAADLEESRTTVHRALELGINLFDTAQGHGFGAAERLLGEALRRPDTATRVVSRARGRVWMAGPLVVARSTWEDRRIRASRGRPGVGVPRWARGTGRDEYVPKWTARRR